MAAVALAAWFVMACPVDSRHGAANPDAYAHIDKCLSPLALEVANDASDRVGVMVRLREAYICYTNCHSDAHYDSGLVVLESGEGREFPIDCPDVKFEWMTMKSGWLAPAFAEVAFFEDGSEEPYRSYSYEVSWCGDDECSAENYIHGSSNGTEDRLFAESSERPFYLEADESFPIVDRVVITFVPSAEDGAESPASRSVGRVDR